MHRRKWRRCCCGRRCCCCCRRRRYCCCYFAALWGDGSIEYSVTGDEEVGAVRGVDSLQGVDGHLVEAHVDFLCFLNDNRFRRHAEEDGVLKKDMFCFVKLSH